MGYEMKHTAFPMKYSCLCPKSNQALKLMSTTQYRTEWVKSGVDKLQPEGQILFAACFCKIKCCRKTAQSLHDVGYNSSINEVNVFTTESSGQSWDCLLSGPFQKSLLASGLNNTMRKETDTFEMTGASSVFMNTKELC